MASGLTRAALLVAGLAVGAAAGWFVRPVAGGEITLPDQAALAGLLRDGAAPLSNDGCFPGETAPEGGWTVGDFLARYLTAVAAGSAAGRLDCTETDCHLTMSWQGPEADKGGGAALRWQEAAGGAYGCTGF